LFAPVLGIWSLARDYTFGPVVSRAEITSFATWSTRKTAILLVGFENIRHFVSAPDNLGNCMGIAATQFCIQAQRDLYRREAFSGAEDSVDAVRKICHAETVSHMRTVQLRARVSGALLA
jgi:hypothetical protein